MFWLGYIIGVFCGMFCMALAKVSKDSEITEYEEEKLLECATKDIESDLQDL